MRPPRRAAGHRYPVLCLLAAAGLAPLILTPNLVLMTALAVLSGLCFAPITTCQIAVIDEVAAPEHKAEAFTWLGTLYGVGLALAASARRPARCRQRYPSGLCDGRRRDAGRLGDRDRSGRSAPISQRRLTMTKPIRADAGDSRLDREWTGYALRGPGPTG
jgi:hypothetical protein